VPSEKRADMANPSKQVALTLFIVVVVLAGCASVPLGDSDGESDTATQTPQEAEVDTQSSDKIDVHSIDVDIAGVGIQGAPMVEISIQTTVENTDLTVVVSGPEDNTVATGRSSESDFFDGSESITRPLENGGVPGPYTFFVVQGSVYTHEKVVEKTTEEFDAPQLEPYAFAIDTEPATFGDEYRISSARLGLRNTGDLPVSITNIQVETATDTGLIHTGRTVLKAGERERFEQQGSTFSAKIPRGEQSITVVVNSGDETILRYHVDVSVD
jgi:hypothetical protein